jgi:myxalamid-type polyketide synthase MxaD
MLPTNPEERLRRLLNDAREKLESERLKRSAPIAIVGIGCRFPGGADSPGTLWRVLEHGVDATGPVPMSRWDADAIYDPDPDAPGMSYVRRGGFLGAVDGFDAAFFGISPREARGLDPQQRLLLETTWEALEDAGVPPERLRGSATGVWVGYSLDDYSKRSSDDPHAALGNARSIAAGRIAYVLDLHGPALQIDTSCSSSLVATHLACQSLRSGECDVAVVGGVNLLLDADSTIALCKLRALAHDGRCKTFDASGDGYARGEGCGVVVLKRLSDVRRYDERVYAVIVGSAVNHDGRSNGLTAPNGAAQEEVIRQALARAGVEPSEVDYVEAHGTGTPLGDPIEALALSRVYGTGRAPDAPLLLGSIKTNMGHLEGAAGIAGLIKTALSLEDGHIPPHLHLKQPNPRIPWHTKSLEVPLRLCPWPKTDRPRRAGVSAFGISGTNAHMILQQAPEVEAPPAAAARSAELVVLSAQSAASLHDAARRLRMALLESPTVKLFDLASALVAKRGAFMRRVGFVASSIPALIEKLGAYVEEAKPMSNEGAGSVPRKLVFVFPGQGSQWMGMGRQLLAEEPAFREHFESCEAAIQAELGWSVVSELMADEATSRMHRMDVVQPLLFAFQVALARTWQAWGVNPDAVLGHSMGEIAAAYIAGALTLPDAVAIICRRSRLLRRISGKGAMALVELSVDEARAAIHGFESRVSIAVSNGSRSTVLSGDPEALAEITETLTSRNVFVRPVNVDVASHSPQVEPLLPELLTELRMLEPTRAQLPMLSTVTGLDVAGSELDATYWADNLRQPVQFARGVSLLLERGFTDFLEVSPHPLLTGAIERLREDAGVEGVALASMRREQPERSALLDALGALFVQGYTLNSERLFPGPAAHVDLPTYAWQRESYWIEGTTRGEEPRAPSGHPLLGGRIRSAKHDRTYEVVIASNSPSWLLAHVVLEEAVFPAAAFLELIEAAARLGTDEPLGIESLAIGVPMVLKAGEAFRVQTSVDTVQNQVSVHSQPVTSLHDGEWTLHANAQLARVAHEPKLDLAELRRRCTRPVDVHELYTRFSSIGLSYGPAFRNLRSIWRGEGEVLAEVSVESELLVERYGIHPALLDGALQAAGALVEGDSLMLPAQMRSFAIKRPGQTRAWVYVRALDASVESVACEVRLLTDASDDIAWLGRLELSRAGTLLTRTAADVGEPALFHSRWMPAESIIAGAPSVTAWIVVATSAMSSVVAAELSRRGQNVELVQLNELTGKSAGAQVVCVWDAGPTGDEAIGQVMQGLAVVAASEGRAQPARLWWVTEAATDVTRTDAINPSAVAMWGLGRTVMQEHPELRCTLLDAASRDIVDALSSETSAGIEQQVAYRNGKRHLFRLMPVAHEAGSVEKQIGLHLDGTVLITGGLGGLGLETARFFAERGAAHLLLVSRRGLETPGARDSVVQLELLGCQVTVAACDVANRASLEQIVSAIPIRYPLRAIVHAAGILDDGILSQQTPERIRRVMSPKVLGAWNLHQLTQDMGVDMFVFFSSLAGTLGSAGQSGYCAANCYLDGLAMSRAKTGLAAQSIAWGPWSGKGLVTTLGDAQLARLRRRGVEVLSDAEGIELLMRALALPEANLVAANLNLAQVPIAMSKQRAPLASAQEGNLRQSLEAAPENERPSMLLGWVRSAVARVLLMRDASTLSAHRPLRDLGLDSLMGLQLRQLIEKVLVVRLPAIPPVAQLSIRDLVSMLGDALSASVTSRLDPEPSDQRGLGAVEPRSKPGREPSKRNGAAEWTCLHPVEEPLVRLFCFHESGGSSSAYQPFGELRAERIEVHAIDHLRGAPVTPELARHHLNQTFEYLASFADRPQVLFGHSGGAIEAWRALLELRERGAHLPILLALSAPPVAPDARASRVDVDAVVRAVAQKGWLATDEAIAAFRERFMSDVELLTSFPTVRWSPVSVPVVCFVGRGDTLVSEADVALWNSSTLSDFSLNVLPGDHFYLGDQASRELVLSELVKRIKDDLASKPPRVSRARRVASIRWG